MLGRWSSFLYLCCFMRKNENFFHFLFTRTTSQSPRLRETSCCRSYVYFLFLHAAIARCFASTAVVTAPTPPGTGVAADAFSSRPSQRTSPQSFPFSSTLIPTSMRTAPSFKNDASSIFAFPAAATRISASWQTAFRFSVFVWQIVTVAFSFNISMDSGRPTTMLRPTITARFPVIGRLNAFRTSITASAVHLSLIHI